MGRGRSGVHGHFEFDAEGFLDSAMDAVVGTDAEGCIRRWNREAEAVFGWSSAEALGRSLTALIPERFREAHLDGMTRYLKTRDANALSRRFELTALHKNGREFPIELTVTAVRVSGRDAFIAFIRDVTQQRRSEDSLRKLADTLEVANQRLEVLVVEDSLTLLMNRRGMARQLSKQLERIYSGGGPVAAILVDLDDFRLVNDALGHASGDVVLREVAARMKSCLRTKDYAGRIGGDEFLVLLPDTDKKEAEIIADRIRLSVASPRIVVHSKPISCTVSAGVMSLPSTLSSLEELLSRAKALLRQSKRFGKNRVFSSGYNITKGASVESILHGGLLRAVQQPIVSIRDRSIVGYEMLVRGPKGAFESPHALFGAWRDRDMVLLADIQCLKVCSSASERAGLRGDIHLNIFPSTLLATPVDRLLALLPPRTESRRICLEISEQQIIGEPGYLDERIAELQARGVSVAIDDVGFGRSPIEALLGLAPDVAKIDRLFVDGISQDSAKRKRCSRLVKVLETLGIAVVAEGVESSADAEVILELGVEHAQGYYWGRPEECLPQDTGNIYIAE